MKTLKHHDTHFVFNSLLNRQPMQSISDHRGDLVELPLAQYDLSCSIEHVLQRLEIGRTRTVEDTVTVVNPTSNESMYHGYGSVFCQGLPYSLYLSQMIETLAGQASDVRWITIYYSVVCSSRLESRDWHSPGSSPFFAAGRSTWQNQKWILNPLYFLSVLLAILPTNMQNTLKYHLITFSAKTIEFMYWT